MSVFFRINQIGSILKEDLSRPILQDFISGLHLKKEAILLQGVIQANAKGDYLRKRNES